MTASTYQRRLLAAYWHQRKGGFKPAAAWRAAIASMALRQHQQ